LTEWTGGESAEAVLARAERALGLAKSSGRNCVRAHHEALRDDEDWTALASGGNLFETTLARDVMAPCPLVLGVDEAIEQVTALAQTTQLAAIPVVDAEGRLAGLVTAAQLEAVRTRSGRPRGGSSVRLLRHVMTTDIQRFDESCPLAELVEFFTGNASTLAVVVRDRRPVGIVHCQGVAALNERLSVSLFSATATLPAGTSDDLVVPDLAMAE
jgi:CBS-domain-containing membrane protein